MTLIQYEDAIERAMMDGILMALEVEMRKEISKVADKVIDDTLNEIKKRVELRVSKQLRLDDLGHNIKLEWLIKKEGKHGGNRTRQLNA